jgi:hypothetical protein
VKHPCLNPRLLIVMVFLVFAPACGDAGENAISPTAATDIIDARSAVLDYLRNTNPDAPPASLSWVDESPTNTGLPGWTESRLGASGPTRQLSEQPTFHRTRVVVADTGQFNQCVAHHPPQFPQFGETDLWE